MTGKLTKRTPERLDRVLDSLRMGLTRRAASASAGMSEDTLARAIKEDADFAESVKIAEGEAEALMTRSVLKAVASGMWTASAWWLERRRPQDYGRKLESMIVVKRPEDMTDDELDALLGGIGSSDQS